MTPLLEPRTTARSAGASGIKRVLLATDLSPASDGATVEAMDLCEDLGADLVAVSVIDPRSMRLPGGRTGARVDQIRSSREREAQGLVNRGRERGIRVAFLIWEGDPGEAIVEAAESEQVDLIVVGSHGRGSVGRLFLGSVSEHVVRNATCPVLVVRGRHERETSARAD